MPDFQEKFHDTDYVVVQLVSGPPWELRIDAHAIGDEIPCNGARAARRSRKHEAPKTRLGFNQTRGPWTLLGVEASFITANADDNAIVSSQVVLSLVHHYSSQPAFVHPISHLVPSVESALASRIRRIEDTLRDYFSATGESPATPPSTAAAVREALIRLGAPMLFDHRRLQIPLYLRPGEFLGSTLSCAYPITLSAPVELRFGFEWIRQHDYL